MSNCGLILPAMAVGAVLAWWSGKRVAMTNIPQMVALGSAATPLEKSIGFIGVLLAAGNAVGGYAVTERMLEMFKSSGARGGKGGAKAGGTH